jgi:hypothetical protein
VIVEDSDVVVSCNEKGGTDAIRFRTNWAYDQPFVTAKRAVDFSQDFKSGKRILGTSKVDAPTDIAVSNDANVIGE